MGNRQDRETLENSAIPQGRRGSARGVCREPLPLPWWQFFGGLFSALKRGAMDYDDYLEECSYLGGP